MDDAIAKYYANAAEEDRLTQGAALLSRSAGGRAVVGERARPARR